MAPPLRPTPASAAAGCWCTLPALRAALLGAAGSVAAAAAAAAPRGFLAPVDAGAEGPASCCVRFPAKHQSTQRRRMEVRNVST
jgi:hypothetical protein